LNIGSAIKSLRILAIAIGCQEKQNIAKSTNRDTKKHKNETKQKQKRRKQKLGQY